MQRADSCEKTLMLGKIEGRRRRGRRGWDGWVASSTQWTWVWVGSGSWWWTGRPGVLWFSSVQFSRSVVSVSLQPHELRSWMHLWLMGSQSQTQLRDWAELNWKEMVVMTTKKGLTAHHLTSYRNNQKHVTSHSFLLTDHAFSLLLTWYNIAIFQNVRGHYLKHSGTRKATCSCEQCMKFF